MVGTRESIGGRRLILGAALAADAEYGEVVQVCFELIFLLEGDTDGLQEAVVVYVKSRAAVPADDVVVPLVVGHFVLVGPTSEVYLDEQTLLFQQLDGAVDGSNVYERVGLLDLFVDILSGHVPRAGSDGGKDHHPLGREPVSGASEGIEKVVCFGQIMRSGEVASPLSHRQ